MSVEGVFRKNGNIRRLKELAESLDKQTSPPSLEDENPVQLAALLKKFLRELPDPLLTAKLFRLWIGSQSLSFLFVNANVRSVRSAITIKSPPSHVLSIAQVI
jgi:RhoGAP domain